MIFQKPTFNGRGLSLSEARGFFAVSSGSFMVDEAASFQDEGTAKNENSLCQGITGRLATPQNASCKAVAVLYARKNSVYKKLPACDVFDLARDARSFTGRIPVIAHPPCRLWGRLYKFSTAPQSEKALALHAVHAVRINGGVLEHPAYSKLWIAAGLPAPGERDEFGGFTLPILQSWFGHKAPKATWLYIVGIEPSDVPAFPFQLGIPTGRICASHSMKLREGTPDDLAQWLVSLAYRCKPQSAYKCPASGIAETAAKAQNAFKAFSNFQKSLFDQVDQAHSILSVSGELDFTGRNTPQVLKVARGNNSPSFRSSSLPSGVTRSRSVRNPNF